MFTIIDVDTGEPVSSAVYPTAAEATQARDLYPGVKTRIKQLVDDSWKAREMARFGDGTYTDLPDYLDEHTKPEHFAHVSTDQPTKIAFTESPEKGMRDIQTVVSVSTYLGRFASLPPHTIRDLAARYESRLTINDDTLKIDYTRNAFRFAYDGQPVKSESSDHVSCMARTATRYVGNFRLSPSPHPAEAYSTDENGLHIAYTIDPDYPSVVTARAVVWPKHMHFVRVYGLDDRYRIGLRSLLEDRGYSRYYSFEGAPLARIGLDCADDNADGSFLMPYLDGETKLVSDHPTKKRFFVCSDGDYAADDTSGVVEVGDGGSNTCDCCSSRIRCNDDSYTVGSDSTWCQSCYENNSMYCDRYEETFDSRDGYETVYVAPYVYNSSTGRHSRNPTSRYLDEQIWCQSAVDNHAFYCDCTNRYYHEEHFTQLEVHTLRNGVETWCAERTEDYYFECDQCGKYFHIDLKHAHTDLLGDNPTICQGCHSDNQIDLEARGCSAPPVHSPTIMDPRQRELPVI